MMLSINICKYITIYLKLYIIVINNHNEVLGCRPNPLESWMSLGFSNTLWERAGGSPLNTFVTWVHAVPPALLNCVRSAHISWRDEMLEDMAFYPFSLNVKVSVKALTKIPAYHLLTIFQMRQQEDLNFPKI